jgi:hypothetical protein
MRGQAASWLVHLWPGDLAHQVMVIAVSLVDGNPLTHLLAKVVPPAVAALGVTWGLLEATDPERLERWPRDEDLWSRP